VGRCGDRLGLNLSCVWLGLCLARTLQLLLGLEVVLVSGFVSAGVLIPLALLVVGKFLQP
jgi:hypothetical protein